MPSIVWTIISFVAIFTIVVVSHEFGHYIIGRLNGINVEEFSIGMGPAIFKKKGKHTTLAIRLLPIGGACMFQGMAPEDEEASSDNTDIEDIEAESQEAQGKKKKLVFAEPKEGDFNYASVWGRIATVVAGPIFNVVLAFLLAIFLCWFCGSDTAQLSGVIPEYPAEAAGLQKGDTIIKIGGQRIYVWREISVISLMNNGKPLDITYERDGERFETTITPMYSEEDGRYYIGFQGGNNFVSCNNLSVFKYAAIEVRYWLVATYRSLFYMISGHASMDDLAGPVGVATVIDDTIEKSSPYGPFVVILNMVNIAVLLSVNLGVVNLIPFPALDGGRFILLIVEAVTGKRVPPDKEAIFHMVGFILLMILMVFVFANDIGRLFR